MNLGAEVKKPSFSMLRYPGGKSVLYPYISKLLKLNGFSNATYIEPYAGGAGVALALLLREQVEKVVINDFDQAIYAFWRAIFTENERFVEVLKSVDISIEEWQRQKTIYKSTNPDLFELGFATFYLNRTNRSGVLNAGVIGGIEQLGKYKIDARFNRSALIENARLLGRYASRIQILNRNGVEVIEEYSWDQNSFVYADPPYFEKGSQLYLNAFKEDDHIALAEVLNRNSDSNWMLTYDNHDFIRNLYPSRSMDIFSLNYSVHNARKANELMVISDNLKAPEGFGTTFVKRS